MRVFAAVKRLLNILWRISCEINIYFDRIALTLPNDAAPAYVVQEKAMFLKTQQWIARQPNLLPVSKCCTAFQMVSSNCSSYLKGYSLWNSCLWPSTDPIEDE